MGSSSPAARTQLIAAAQRCRGVLRTTLLAVAAANTQQSWGIAFPFRVELRSRSWTRDIDRDILGFGGGDIARTSGRLGVEGSMARRPLNSAASRGGDGVSFQ